MRVDKELLELAGKAAGYKRDVHGFIDPACPLRNWAPLDNDGDALRLAVKLRITVKLDDQDACCAGWSGTQRAPTTDGVGPWYWKEWNSGDPQAAARRAIVRAAAEIGRQMP